LFPTTFIDPLLTPLADIFNFWVKLNDRGLDLYARTDVSRKQEFVPWLLPVYFIMVGGAPAIQTLDFVEV
jgi:hypothetical protein